MANDDKAQRLFKQGVAAARQGDKDTARKALSASLKLDPTNENAWFALATVAKNDDERLKMLRRLMQLNPQNAQGLKLMERLGLTMDDVLPGQSPPPLADEPQPPSPPPFAEPKPFASTEEVEAVQPPQEPGRPLPPVQRIGATPPPQPLEQFQQEPEPAAPPPVEPLRPPRVGPPGPPPGQPGIPVPDGSKLARAEENAEVIVEEFLTPPLPPDGIEWVQKTKGRAGEREVVLVRLAIGTASTITTLVVLAVAGYALLQVPAVQEFIDQSTPTRFISLAEPTATGTPETTPTNTPGQTATPSPTPAPFEEGTPTPTETATVPPQIDPGDPLQPVATDVSFPIPLDNAGRTSAINIAAGQYELALPTLAVAIEDTRLSFDVSPYYLRSLALALSGERNEAIGLLDAAERRRIEESPNDPESEGLIRSGYAEVYYELGRQALERGETNQANNDFSRVNLPAEEAIVLLPDYAPPYLALARRHRAAENYEAALDVLNAALDIGDLEDDVRLITERGRVFFDQGLLAPAQYQAFFALFVDPLSEPAHLLNTEIALQIAEETGDVQDAGDAVLAAQGYLRFHPRSVVGWTMLGQARELEGNTLLAIQAYSQAVQIGDNAEEQPVALEALRARADLYTARNQFALAAADLDAAIEAGDSEDLRARQLRLAYRAGELERVVELVEELSLSEDATISDGVLSAYAVLSTASEANSQSEYQDLVDEISQNFNLYPEDLQPEINTIRARALVELEEPQQALTFIESAISEGGDTAGRRLVRAGVYVELAQADNIRLAQAEENFLAARADYDWVLTFSQLYPIEQLVLDAQDGLAALERAENQVQINATATAEA